MIKFKVYVCTDYVEKYEYDGWCDELSDEVFLVTRCRYSFVLYDNERFMICRATAFGYCVSYVTAIESKQKNYTSTELFASIINKFGME